MPAHLPNRAMTLPTLTRIAFVAAFAPCLSLSAAVEKAKWMTDFEAAKKTATEEKKDLLLDFTGSDWCSWCVRLDEEVFEQEAFAAAVADKFVLVKLDFPRDESKITPEIKAQNEKLGEQYAVEGFPSIILADHQGRPYARTGYQAGGAEKYLPHLDELRKKREARDSELAAAGKLEGVEKARKLQNSIADFSDATVDAFYPEIAEQIVAADPKDETGFHKARSYRKAVVTYEENVGVLFEARKFDEAIKAADAFLAEHEPTGLDKQHVLMAKVIAFVETGQQEPAMKLLDEIKTIAPDSEIGAAIDGMKERIESHMAQQAPAPVPEEETTEDSVNPAPEETAPAPEKPAPEASANK